MRCYQRLCIILCKDHVTNEEVCWKIQAAIGEYDELLTLEAEKRILMWFGHISKSSGLAMTILQGQWKDKEEADIRRGEKTVLKSAQDWNL